MPLTMTSLYSVALVIKSLYLTSRLWSWGPLSMLPSKFLPKPSPVHPTPDSLSYPIIGEPCVLHLLCAEGLSVQDSILLFCFMGSAAIDNTIFAIWPCTHFQSIQQTQDLIFIMFFIHQNCIHITFVYICAGFIGIQLNIVCMFLGFIDLSLPPPGDW